MKEQLTLRVLSDQNAQQQYDRGWNLRVYNVEEKARETADDCAMKCCRILTDRISVPTTEEDLEAAHRTEPVTTGRKRPIIIRFHSKKLKDKMLANQKKLKSKGVSVDGRPNGSQLQTGKRCVQTLIPTCILVLARQGSCQIEEQTDGLNQVWNGHRQVFQEGNAGWCLLNPSSCWQCSLSVVVAFVVVFFPFF